MIRTSVDGSGEDQKFFDQVSRATAGQVNRDGLMSPRDAARALFAGGVKGAATSPQVSGENYRALELIEYSPEPIPLISTQFIFNRTNTPNMAANPTQYRAYAESLFGGGVTLAGQIPFGTSFKPPPPLPILPYTDSVGVDATNSLYDGTSRLTATFPILLYDSQIGVQSSTAYPYGIGFRIRYRISNALWTLTIKYYASNGVFVTRTLVANNVQQYVNGQRYDGVLIVQRANTALQDTNVDVFLKMSAATIVPPAGFLPPPVGITTFDGTNLAVCPQLIWDATLI
jgi:hypothetical protein